MKGSGMPRRSSGTRNRARPDAIATSQCSTRSMPPAWHRPLIFATQGLLHRSTWRNGNCSTASHSTGKVDRVFGAPAHVATGAEPLVGARDAHGVELHFAVGPHRGALQRAVHAERECVP